MTDGKLKLAQRVIDIISATEVTDHISDLTTLDPFIKDGVWVTQGRMKKGLPQIFGVLNLQLLLPHQRLVELVMIAANNKNHDGSATTLTRSRSQAWIHRGRKLAQRIANDCQMDRAQNVN